ncbi:hypothetical protein HDV01_006640 [Terramyces sp. JEL0728]|nr:hypothetical protein HDV01_006640 [Terramyces sp. JEL0728]
MTISQEESQTEFSMKDKLTKEVQGKPENEDLPEGQLEQEGEENEDQSHREMIDKLTLNDAYILLQEGTQALALGLYDDAAEKLAIAVELQVKHLGQYALEVAPTFYLYGKALLAVGAQKNSVLGEKADQPVQEQQINNPNFSFQGDEEDLEDDEGKVLDEIELPPADDLELAWENLDVARLIFSTQTDEKSIHQLAEVHLSLGDVSLESENFEQAIKDFETALGLKKEHFGGNYRELAEAHFKLALSFEYSELNEEACEQVNLAMEALHKRIEDLLPSNSKGKAPLSKEIEKEVSEIHESLADLEMKLGDLNTLIDKETEGEQIAPSKAPAQDISSLVKKRKTEDTKIENYEAADKSALNQDQIEAIGRKPEVSYLIKEFEEVMKQLAVIEEEQLLQAQKEAEGRQLETNQLLEEKRAEVELQLQDAQNHLHLINFALNVHWPALIGRQSINEAEFNALVLAKTSLFGPFVGVQRYSIIYLSATASVDFSRQFHEKLYTKSQELFAGSHLTYAQIDELIVRLMNPPSEPKFGMFGVTVEPEPLSFPTTQSSDSINFLSEPIVKEPELEDPVEGADDLILVLEEKVNKLVIVKAAQGEEKKKKRKSNSPKKKVVS